ncbi:hypothetical protein HYT95_03345, partial [Candidatus Peregrinibacteria bacterium]|nr:hypothetical protein [Candidatus Peregrinibacteria bacterium]
PRSPISALVPSGASPLLTPSGITLLQGRPGMLLPFSVTYRGGQAQTPQLARIADVTADQGIFLWQERGKRFVPIRSSLQIPKKLGARETLQLRLHVQFPMKSGEYRLHIGPIRYTLLVAGKRAKAAGPLSLVPLSPPSDLGPRDWELGAKNITKTQAPVPKPQSLSPSPPIRIRLTFSSDTAIVLLPDDALINGIHPAGREILLFRDTETCTAKERGKNIASGVIRIDGHSPFAITDGKNIRRYSGVLECLVIDDALTLINELPLEDYLLGLAEEPDTEPEQIDEDGKPKPDEELDWLRFYHDGSDLGYVSSRHVPHEDIQGIEHIKVDTPSLAEHLLWQLRQIAAPDQIPVGEFLIHSLDPRGFFTNCRTARNSRMR